MINIKEEFYRHAKAKRAYKKGKADALLLWHQMKAYSAEHATDGYVPTEAIEEFEFVPRNLTKCFEALRDCGEKQRDGTRGPGLIVEADHGWQLHDYGDHSISSDEINERRQKDRDRKKAQRERAALRGLMVKEGSTARDAEERVRDMSRDEVRALLKHYDVTSRDMSRDTKRDSHGTVTGQSQATPAPAPPRAPARPSPTQPNPAQPSPATEAAALSTMDWAGGLLSDPLKITLVQPQKHPAVLDFVSRLAEACDWSTPRFSPAKPHEDKGLLAVLALLATFTPAELDAGIESAAYRDSFLKKPGKGLSSCSVEVWRRLISNHGGPSIVAGQPDYPEEERVSFSD